MRFLASNLGRFLSIYKHHFSSIYSTHFWASFLSDFLGEILTFLALNLVYKNWFWNCPFLIFLTDEFFWFFFCFRYVIFLLVGLFLLFLRVTKTKKNARHKNEIWSFFSSGIVIYEIHFLLLTNLSIENVIVLELYLTISSFAYVRFLKSIW
jgi:hypothetical protein